MNQNFVHIFIIEKNKSIKKLQRNYTKLINIKTKLEYKEQRFSDQEHKEFIEIKEDNKKEKEGKQVQKVYTNIKRIEEMELFYEIASMNQANYPDLTNTLYKYITPFQQRVNECQQIIVSYPDYVPMIIEKHPNAKIDSFKKKKLVIQGKMDILKLQSVIRNHIQLKENDTISIFVHDGYMERLKLLNLGSRLSDVLEKYKADDGFLYITYSEFSSFG